MTTVWRTALVVLAAMLAGIVRAEPTLRYNYNYACNQEHIVVGHCRKDSDTPDMPPTTPEDDFCQLYYPDRPKTGGIEAMGIELRSDVIKILQACGAFGPPKSASQSDQRPAATAAPRPASPAPAPAAAAASGRAPVAAPGIGQEHWRNVNFGDDRAVFVLPANLKPGGPTGRGWFLKMYRVPLQSADGRITQIAIAEELWTADCTHNTIASLESSYFSADGAPLGAYVVPSPEHISVDPGTVGEDMLNLLCARPYELDQVDYDSDAVTIRKIWLRTASSKPSASSQAATGSPSQGPAATAPGGRPPPAAMPIGPAMCPLLHRVEVAAHEEFRSIDLGPDRAMGKDADVFHRTSISIPGVNCLVEHDPDMPIRYVCIWPQSKDVDDQFVSMVKTLEKCTGGTADTSMVEETGVPDVTMKLRGLEYSVDIVSDALSFSVHRQTP